MSEKHTEIVGGVDTHRDVHVAAAVDATGALLATAPFAANAAGYGELATWLATWGPVRRVGVEGTGSYGAGLARHLAAAGVEVVEVNRPNRQTRRRAGKSDTVDAAAAARAALAGDATAVPKAHNGPVEAIRMLTVARRSAVKARTQAHNQIHSLLVTVPEALKDHLSGHRGGALIDACARLRPATTADALLAAAKRALRSLARRHQALSAEIAALDGELRALCAAANPALLAAHGVGPDTAAALLIAAGDNPQRLHSDASFAALCGASPIQASSGQTTRHRLNRGGDRHANQALWRIAMVRLRHDPRTQAYAARAPAKAKPPATPSAASNATSPAKSTTSSPTHTPHPTDPTSATNAKTTTSPSPQPPQPSTPTPAASAPSNEAPTTTTPSPPTTTPGSPNKPLDKHRSIGGGTAVAALRVCCRPWIPAFAGMMGQRW